MDKYILDFATAEYEKMKQLARQAERLRGIVANQSCDPHLYLHDGQAGFDLLELAYDRLGIHRLQKGVLEKLRLTDSFSVLSRLLRSLVEQEDRIQQQKDKHSSETDDTQEGLTEQDLDILDNL